LNQPPRRVVKLHHTARRARVSLSHAHTRILSTTVSTPPERVRVPRTSTRSSSSRARPLCIQNRVIQPHVRNLRPPIVPRARLRAASTDPAGDSTPRPSSHRPVPRPHPPSRYRARRARTAHRRIRPFQRLSRVLARIQSDSHARSLASTRVRRRSIVARSIDRSAPIAKSHVAKSRVRRARRRARAR